MTAIPGPTRMHMFRRHDISAHTKAHDVKTEARIRQGSRSGQAGQRLVPDPLGAVGETSPRVASSKRTGHSIRTELNHVQSTHVWHPLVALKSKRYSQQVVW